MKIIRSSKKMLQISRKAKLKRLSVGFVPTMGALHAGHLSLIKKARKDNDIVIVSIFVNPAQFGPKEDLKKYPRNLREDARACKDAGTDFIFYPGAVEIYPINYATFVNVEGLSGLLCGKFRPGHFRGVTTIVAKLFNIVNPDYAYFGQKDAQQAVIIKRLVCDLSMPVKIRVMPTIREKDGLAMSSRNAYLNEDERKIATVLYKALMMAKILIKNGQTNSRVIITKMKRLILTKKNTRVEYISVVDPDNLNSLEKIKGKALIALAVWIGKIRLIDNAIVNL